MAPRAAASIRAIGATAANSHEKLANQNIQRGKMTSEQEPSLLPRPLVLEPLEPLSTLPEGPHEGREACLSKDPSLQSWASNQG